MAQYCTQRVPLSLVSTVGKEKPKTGIQLPQYYRMFPRGPLRFHLMRMAWGISEQDYYKSAEDREGCGTHSNKCVNLADRISAASGTWADMPTSSLPISTGELVAPSTQGTCSVFLPSPSLGPQTMSPPGHFTNPNLESKASQQPCPIAELRFQPHPVRNPWQRPRSATKPMQWTAWAADLDSSSA